ncbi:hypothetical protein KUTeg_020118 [Tegillarca granosa]|uniref:RNA polymerase II-associated protein 3 n=1 Tax=Tegillarca granosa TaxID=220873 RepID=A0ABQ9E6V6_TEGGR|nr:hypothetical protein KUTeg_020118 [Tegillarca granosa]
MAVSDHEKKMVQLQHDMRNSQKDLADYLSDMTSWEDEIKQKEKQLLSQKQNTDEELSKEKMVAQTEPSASPYTGIVYPITKPPHERSKIKQDEKLKKKIQEAADKSGDMKTTDRKLDRKLILIVQQKLGNDLRWTANKALVNSCGNGLESIILGNAPCGYFKYKIPKTADGVKMFFFKACYKGGNVKLSDPSIKDYKWVTHDELSEYMKPKSWDKFDVKSDSSEYETDEEWEMERKKQQALIEKDRGNELFKKGDYSSAIEAYTRGMTLDPTNPLLSANRAMALLKQEKYAAAELDCVTALSLDPLYVKAYLRRGSARFGLKKFTEAKEDFEKELSKEKMVAQTEPSASPDTGIVYPITKPPHERSKKPLRRIEVEEVGVDDDELQKAAIAKLIANQSDTKKQMTQRDNQMFEQFTDSSDSVQKKVQNNISMDDKSQTSRNKENISDKSHQNIVKPEFNLTSDQDSTVKTSRLKTVPKTTDTKLDLSSVSDSKHSDDSPSVSPRSLPVPQTSFQFQKDYKVVKNNLEAFYNYLKKIDPCQYQKLFGESMDAEILMKMLTVFKDYYISSNEDFYPHLCNLTQVKRFSMTVIFDGTI